MNETGMDQHQESAQAEEAMDIDPQMAELAFEKFRSEQNLLGGVVAGAVAALVGAAIWAAVTVVTEFQIGWMAVGVGFLVGFAVRIAGKGIDRSFAVAGALLALLGCVLGNLFAICQVIATNEQMGFFDVLVRLDATVAFELMKATFHPMDVLFYGIAVYEGFKLSPRQITEEELVAAMRGSGAGTISTSGP
jgi:hypothetical protein